MKQPVKEGTILKNYLKGTGKKLEDYASDLQMTRQGLDYHLNKPILDANFKEIIKDKLGIDFTKVKSEYPLNESKSKDSNEDKTNIVDTASSGFLGYMARAVKEYSTVSLTQLDTEEVLLLLEVEEKLKRLRELRDKINEKNNREKQQ